MEKAIKCVNWYINFEKAMEEKRKFDNAKKFLKPKYDKYIYESQLGLRICKEKVSPEDVHYLKDKAINKAEVVLRNYLKRNSK